MIKHSQEFKWHSYNLAPNSKSALLCTNSEKLTWDKGRKTDEFINYVFSTYFCRYDSVEKMLTEHLDVFYDWYGIFPQKLTFVPRWSDQEIAIIKKQDTLCYWHETSTVFVLSIVTWLLDVLRGQGIMLNPIVSNSENEHIFSLQFLFIIWNWAKNNFGHFTK